MKSKQVWRYWCDFCGKARLQKAAMVKHEKHCTLNPHRECRVCKFTSEASKPLPALLALLPSPPVGQYDNEKWQEFYRQADAHIPALREAAGGCPACMMAALRQAKIPLPAINAFNYTEEISKLWHDVNAALGSKRTYCRADEEAAMVQAWLWVIGGAFTKERQRRLCAFLALALGSK